MQISTYKSLSSLVGYYLETNALNQRPKTDIAKKYDLARSTPYSNDESSVLYTFLKKVSLKDQINFLNQFDKKEIIEIFNHFKKVAMEDKNNSESEDDYQKYDDYMNLLQELKHEYETDTSKLNDLNNISKENFISLFNNKKMISSLIEAYSYKIDYEKYLAEACYKNEKLFEKVVFDILN
ncbi:hypothetical protein BX659_1478 [Orenia metallireducens]|uniref:Uncharacterized protein n=1 Tax=Orenia metallireducens TaxID=1413210 RepID=A0A285IGV8_9FIRM|nr:hypothetical protein [Orenia metallireducens]PRX17822.1 hypothetical protein BX659_1478 [Orenia metallireducens]SNY47208.1 hypothetical protein SAMN06265827_1488 [Orenia metallireducens]